MKKKIDEERIQEEKKRYLKNEGIQRREEMEKRERMKERTNMETNGRKETLRNRDGERKEGTAVKKK